MALAKLKILVEKSAGVFGDKGIEAQFNPEQIVTERNVNWAANSVPESDSPELQFIQGRGSDFNIDLMFDTYLTGGNVVEKFTGPVMDLSMVDGSLHRPPLCRLSYGLLGEFFEGVLAKVQQKLTMFLDDGTPVRATLSCTFKEWKSIAEQAKEQKRESTDVAKTYVVQHGDSLSGIAAVTLHDPRLWRPIAIANGIDNPRRLTPGQRLLIPVLTGEEE